MKQSTAGLIIVLLALSLASCEMSDYEKASLAVVTISRGCESLKNIIIEANIQGRVSTESARVIMQALDKVVLANQRASATIRKLAEVKRLDPNARIDLFLVVHPVIQTLEDVISSEGLGKITDVSLRDQIILILANVQMALRGLEATLVGGNDGVESEQGNDSKFNRDHVIGECRFAAIIALGNAIQAA